MAPAQRGRRALAGHLLRRLPDHAAVIVREPLDVAGEEGPVADEVDEPGDAAGEAVHAGRGRRAVKPTFPSPPATTIRCRTYSLGLGEGQGREVVARGHPLRELPQLVAGEEVPQLRLAHQHDLDELLGVGLQVRDEADLLEHLRREVLGLVDQQDDVAVRRPRLEEEAVERVHQALLRRRPAASTWRSSRIVRRSSSAVSAG